jgi:hypothetical protein
MWNPVVSRIVDIRFVEAATPGDEVVDRGDSEYLSWRNLFIVERTRVEAYIAAGEFKKSTKEQAEAWLKEMNNQMWTPERQVLVKRPVR